MRKSLSKIEEEKVIAIVRGVYEEDCVNLARALHEGGVNLLEVTFDQRSAEERVRTANTVRMLNEALGHCMAFGAGTVTMFPILQITTKIGLNNLFGLAVVQAFTGGASNLFLTMGYLKTISKDLDDAAKIDGCTFFSIWWRIILPLSKPILATVALMTFRGSWNSYLLPKLMLAGNPKSTTLVVAVVKLQSMGGAGASQYNLMMAGTMLAAMPMIILFLCMNKMFVAGITQGAVKG